MNSSIISLLIIANFLIAQEANTKFSIPVDPKIEKYDGIDYSFGILLNGIEVDPVAAEPWPHSDQGFNDPDVNWEWNLEASMAGLGIDCNRAHVQPTGAYHYHGVPSSYFSSLDITSRTLVGYAADGFSIYYDPA